MEPLLINGDCLEVMKTLEDNSIDLVFCDLPYGQTSCSWDIKIDFEKFWKEINRITRETTPIFFTTTTRFGVELIMSNPKNFRYDLVWIKSASVGFLNAKKMPMRKHEMIYVFYRKLPLYDLSSHSHKFIKEETGLYDPPLPNSVITTKLREDVNGLYGNETKKIFIYENGKLQNNIRYEPPLPNSVIKDTSHYQYNSEIYGNKHKPEFTMRKNGESVYEPPLPNSILEIKSQKGKHTTQKPIALMEWILKYYSKEGDTVLDPTMGSGSTGIACKNMNRKFIGIELNKEIFDAAKGNLGL